MSIVTIGIALAKNVFAVHGVDESGNPLRFAPSKRGKNDAADGRPHKHFVPIKTIDQQSLLCVRRLREGFKTGPPESTASVACWPRLGW